MSEKQIKGLIKKESKKLSLKTLVSSYGALLVLGKKEGIGVATQWKLKPIIKLAKEKFEMYQEIYDSKVRELGEKKFDKSGKDTGKFKVKAENQDKFEKEMKKLDEQEVDIEIPEITYSELKGDNEEFTIPTLVLVELDWLIKEE